MEVAINETGSSPRQEWTAPRDLGGHLLPYCANTAEMLSLAEDLQQPDADDLPRKMHERLQFMYDGHVFDYRSP